MRVFSNRFLASLMFYLFLSQIAYAKPKEEPVKVDLFVMGHCPFSVELENTLAIVLQEVKQPIRINFYYIATETSDGNFQSLRGAIEVEEDMRQLVIQRYYPDKFWKYLKSRNSDYRRPEWKPHVYWAGLSPDEIEKKIQQEGKALLKENVQKAQQLGIKNSPVLYIKDQPYQGSRSLPALVSALSPKEKGCFSDADCIDPSGTQSGRCIDPGSPKARCELFTLPLKIIVPIANFPLSPRPLQMLTQQIPNLKPAVQTMAWDTPEAKEILSQIPATTLPLYVWGDNFVLLDSVSSLENYGVIQAQETPNGKKFYRLSDNFIQPNFYLNRPHQPNQMDLFVMSQCPFGAWAEDQILPIARANGIQIAIHYIVQEQMPNPAEPQLRILTSLHGSAELEENIRQLCIQKYFPDRHADYLLERNKDFQSSLWDPPAIKNLGENSLDTIRNCVQKEGSDLLLQNIQLTQELGINSSPTVLWENRYRFNQLSELKQTVSHFSNIALKEGGCGSK